jgi:hypothetical protein
MNDFLYKWQPQVAEGDLVIKEERLGGKFAETKIHCSEGDTLFINQDGNYDKTQRVWIDREMLYNLVFNFMSTTEIIELATKRSQHEVRTSFKPYVPTVEK